MGIISTDRFINFYKIFIEKSVGNFDNLIFITLFVRQYFTNCIPMSIFEIYFLLKFENMQFSSKFRFSQNIVLMRMFNLLY